jgi:hypothetical protein
VVADSGAADGPLADCADDADDPDDGALLALSAAGDGLPDVDEAGPDDEACGADAMEGDAGLAAVPG